MKNAKNILFAHFGFSWNFTICIFLKLVFKNQQISEKSGGGDFKSWFHRQQNNKVIQHSASCKTVAFQKSKQVFPVYKRL